MAFAAGVTMSGAVQSEPGVNFTEQFETASLSNWHVANYDFSHPHFDTDWRPGQINIEEGALLNLTPKTGADNRFDGASLRRDQKSHYGRYEVVMQPAKGSGIITGFFTYTGPYYGTQHDEIDIEFLGKDTTRMHVAWFVDGERTNKFIDLGFDAADKPRLYAFEWFPDRLRWFADDKLLFEHRAEDGAIPQEPSFLFANIWAAETSNRNVRLWSGEVTEPDRAYQSKVLKMSYQAASPAQIASAETQQALLAAR